MEIDDIKAEDMTALNAQGYTENDLAMLAPSEVQALLAVGADGTSGDHEGSNADHDAAAAEQDAAEQAAAAAATTSTAAATAAAEGSEDGTDDDAADAGVQFKVEVPADALEQIKTLKDEDKAAFKQLMDGVIDADAYQVIKERVEASVDSLKELSMQARTLETVNKQTAEQNAVNAWKAAETEAFTVAKAEGLDYRGKPALLAAFNHNLRALGADPKNERRDAPWFLTEAHRLTKEALGITAVAPVVKKGATTTPKAVDLSTLPPTLRSVPTAATGAIDGDEFAHMRNLEGLALERAHASLTDAQRDRWMAE